MAEYTNRREERLVIHDVDFDDRDGRVYVEIRTESGTGFVVPVHNDEMAALGAGDEVTLETTNFSTITGLKGDGDWWFRKSDEDLAAEHEAFVEKFRQERIEKLAAKREEWTRREAALPDDLRRRLEFFRERAGDEFELDGWGYELIICELADLYRKNDWHRGQDDPEAVVEYARREGTTGNQHGVAMLLVEVLASTEMDLTEVPSGLTPITGNPDYASPPEK